MRIRAFAAAVAVVLVGLATLALPTAAQAATADRWGFAYVDNPAVSGWTDLDHTHQYGSWKATAPTLWAQGIRLTTGQFEVRFPKVGATHGNVHVTAVSDVGAFCQIIRFGPRGTDEIVDVGCFVPWGTPVDSRFTVAWTSSTGVVPASTGTYASMQYGPTGLAQSYNSTGGSVLATPLSVGKYQVIFIGVGDPTGPAGDIQVTAMQSSALPRHCKVDTWTTSGADVIVNVTCYDGSAGWVNTEFTVSYQRSRPVIASAGPPTLYGYLWTEGPAGTNFNKPAGGLGYNSYTTVSLGRTLALFPLLGQKATHAQVTGYGWTTGYCGLSTLWAVPAGNVQLDVLCFDGGGSPKPTRYFATVTSNA